RGGDLAEPPGGGERARSVGVRIGDRDLAGAGEQRVVVDGEVVRPGHVVASLTTFRRLYELPGEGRARGRHEDARRVHGRVVVADADREVALGHAIRDGLDELGIVEQNFDGGVEPAVAADDRSPARRALHVQLQDVLDRRRQAPEVNVLLLVEDVLQPTVQGTGDDRHRKADYHPAEDGQA